MHSAASTPAQHHYTEAEQGLAQLARLGLDEPERLVETLVAMCHAVLVSPLLSPTRQSAASFADPQLESVPSDILRDASD